MTLKGIVVRSSYHPRHRIHKIIAGTPLLQVTISICHRGGTPVEPDFFDSRGLQISNESCLAKQFSAIGSTQNMERNGICSKWTTASKHHEARIIELSTGEIVQWHLVLCSNAPDDHVCATLHTECISLRSFGLRHQDCGSTVFSMVCISFQTSNTCCVRALATERLPFSYVILPTALSHVHIRKAHIWHSWINFELRDPDKDEQWNPNKAHRNPTKPLPNGVQMFKFSVLLPDSEPWSAVPAWQVANCWDSLPGFFQSRILTSKIH